jgi:hypothetical protein
VERRVVVVKNIEMWRKNAKVWKVVFSYLEHPSLSTVLVITHGREQQPMRERVKEICRCSPLRSTRLPRSPPRVNR